MVGQNTIDLIEAQDRYFTHRQNELSDGSIRTYRHRIDHFVIWCDERDVVSTQNIDPQLIYEFKNHLTTKYDSQATVRGYLIAVSTFLKYCAQNSALDIEIASLLSDLTPTASEINARNRSIDPEQIKSLLDVLSEMEYSSRNHLIMRLLWVTGMRSGALRSIDLEDINKEEMCIELVHRPDTDTPLKNGTRGERMVSVDGSTMAVIQAYINHSRDLVTDTHGRDPFVTTRHGRISSRTIALNVGQQTRPCLIDGDCPEGHEQRSCEWWQYENKAEQCPVSYSPHEIRRASITYHLNNDVPIPIVSEKMNSSEQVLRKHYDARTEHEKMTLRKEHTDSLF